MSKPPAKQEKTGNQPDGTSIEAEIERAIGDVVQNRGARQQVVARMTLLMSERFSGPIAHPRHLREYEEICPGSAGRIIAMAEKRADHLIDMDRGALNAEIEDQKRGMRFGAGLFALLIIAAFGSAYLELGPAIVGMFLGTASIGGIGMIIKGRNGG